jgi:4-diphosphocytidyl-2-C-methyl-D-erythritol kinase
VTHGAGERPRGWADVAARACNDFQPVIAEINPEIGRALEALEDAGASFALMSGSGSSVLGLLDSRESAERVATALHQELGWACRAVRTLEAMPRVELLRTA